MLTAIKVSICKNGCMLLVLFSMRFTGVFIIRLKIRIFAALKDKSCLYKLEILI